MVKEKKRMRRKGNIMYPVKEDWKTDLGKLANQMTLATPDEVLMAGLKDLGCDFIDCTIDEDDRGLKIYGR